MLWVQNLGALAFPPLSVARPRLVMAAPVQIIFRSFLTVLLVDDQHAVHSSIHILAHFFLGAFLVVSSVCHSSAREPEISVQLELTNLMIVTSRAAPRKWRCVVHDAIFFMNAFGTSS